MNLTAAHRHSFYIGYAVDDIEGCLGILSDLRDTDKKEMVAMGKTEGELRADMIEVINDKPYESYLVYDRANGDKPCVVFGCNGLNAHVGIVWLLARKEFRAFNSLTRLTKLYLAHWLTQHENLLNATVTSAHRNLLWLQSLGFETSSVENVNGGEPLTGFIITRGKINV